MFDQQFSPCRDTGKIIHNKMAKELTKWQMNEAVLLHVMNQNYRIEMLAGQIKLEMGQI